MSFFRPATALMVQYAHYHRDRRNIATHLVGVPLIFMAVGIMLTQPQWVVADRLLTPAWLVWGLTSLWYLSRGNFLLGLATVAVNGLLIALAMPSGIDTRYWISVSHKPSEIDTGIFSSTSSRGSCADTPA